MWHFKTMIVQVIVKFQGVIKKGRNKHINDIPGNLSLYEIQKSHYLELVIWEEYYQRDWKYHHKKHILYPRHRLREISDYMHSKAL